VEVVEGSTDPRVETVLRTLESYRSGNLQGMQQHMAFDVSVEATGDNPLAGTYEGIGGVMAFIGRSMGTFDAGSVVVEEVDAHGDEVHVIVKGEMALIGGDTAAVRIRQRYWFREDGKVSRIRAEAADDQDEFDRLLTEQARRL
jgi:ketosteroid isomerase-like protein